MQQDLRELLVRIGAINQEVSGGEIYIVGGFLRDYLLRRASDDVDLLVTQNAREVGKAVADQLNGAFIVLNEFHQVFRVVLRDSHYQFDFVGQKAGSLADDLVRRDFTINAFAIKLRELLAADCVESIEGAIVDLFQGKRHLEDRLIKSVTDEAFFNDPLRIIRGVRLAANLDFNISTADMSLMQEASDMTNWVSGERIKEELWRILATPHSAKYLKQLFDINFLTQIIPPENLLNDNFRLMIHIEKIIAEKIWPKELSHQVEQYLAQATSCIIGGKRIILKLACLLSQQQANREVVVQQLTARLKLSNLESQLLKILLNKQEYPLLLFNEDNLSEQAKRRFFYNCGEETIGILILSLANVTLTCQATEDLAQGNQFQDFVFMLIREFLAYNSKKELLPSLITGKEIMELLNITQGHEIGRILSLVKDAQIDGEIKSKEEAIKYCMRCQKKD